MEFYGLVGARLSHSLSPEINNRIYELLNVEGAYKLFEISNEDIGKLGEAIKLLKIKGVNVTIPYKEVVMDQLDEISKEAQAIGAINTILFKNGKLYGYNTDYFGFGSMLSINNIEVKGKSCVILGTGGASKAVATYLMDEEAKNIYLVSRDKNKDIKINPKMKLIDYAELKDIHGDIIINTTPVGMYPNVGVSPVTKDILKKYDTLVDIVYNPETTEFMRLGQELGKKTCGGLYMLVGQAVKAEELWLDRNIDMKVLNKIYEEIENKFK
ncbi:MULTISPECIES: shikimate dehydrogenase [Clostridium]|uniref:Shikimate dehydrogenase (NADP(+)) n=1 Tax=Clostridium cibarium TaxID=2762247 RepID=A0ABR8PQB5_9CLOT|nr:MULTISPECIES: shikimate dehydrogenase [Clostridium]MBD7910269.1 shikimate dehydrogenase [Clostridium cibarium]